MNDYLVFDLETQRSAQDVGGWHNIVEMKMSVGVLWDSAKNDFFIYLEDQVMDLIAHLKSGPTVIGYNHIGFDYVVLSGYGTTESERKNMRQELNDWNVQINFEEVWGELLVLPLAENQTFPNKLFDDLDFVPFIMFFHIQPVAEGWISHYLLQEKWLEDGLVLWDNC